MIEAIPPGLLLIVGGLLLPLLPERRRADAVVMLPLLGLVILGVTPIGAELTWSRGGNELVLVRVDALSKVFGFIFHAAAALAGVYSWGNRDLVQQVAALTYAGGAIAAVFAGDLVTLFLFWEVTAITSVFLIWARRTERSFGVGMRYLIIQVLSGVLMLSGAVMWFSETGSLAITEWTHEGHGLRGMFAFDSLSEAHPAALLIFLSLGIKAAFPGLHGWLKEAYPEGTVTGSVWLSSFTTKLAIYALARLFAGTELLILIGSVMAIFPLILGVIEDDLRRVLAYGLNNQLGFMVVAAGVGTELAINGLAAHAVAHILYKGLLFMGMGAVLLRVGHVRASGLGGLAKAMPWTTAFTIVGAISSFPLLGAFVTKAMILSATAQAHHTMAFVVLTVGAAGVFLLAGIKVVWFAFYGQARDHGEVSEAPKQMLWAMGASAAALLFIGVRPGALYALLPFDMRHLHYVAYDVTHVVTTLQLMVGTMLAFAALQRFGLYPAEVRGINLEVDWLYRVAGKRAALTTGRLLDAAYVAGRDRLYAEALSLSRRVRQWHSPGGLLGEPWPIGSAAIAAAVILVVFLAMGWMG